MKQLWMMALTAVLVVGATAAASAQTKVAVLDVAKVVSSANATKKSEESLTKLRDASRDKISKLEAPLLEKRRKLEEKKTMISQEQYLEQQSALRKEIREFKAETQGLQEEFQNEIRLSRQRVLEAVNEIVTAMAQEKGYDIVVSRAILLYAGDSIDISDVVLEKLNQKLK